jgi:DNA-binding CsgD family transcriptional regulator
MYPFRRVLAVVRSWFKRDQTTKNFTLDIEMIRSLRFLAERERRSPEEIANRILEDALHSHQRQEENWQRWVTLTPREQEVAALICLNYTSRQIAAKLFISPETVKTHVEHILLKFGVPDRNTLRLILTDWNFSEWDK